MGSIEMGCMMDTKSRCQSDLGDEGARQGQVAEVRCKDERRWCDLQGAAFLSLSLSLSGFGKQNEMNVMCFI